MSIDLGHAAALYRADLRQLDLARTSCAEFLLQGLPADQAQAAAYRARASELRVEIRRLEYRLACHSAAPVYSHELALTWQRERDTLTWAVAFLEDLARAAYTVPAADPVWRRWWQRPR